jgi:RND family efflux transporter MFP subunit
MLGDLEFAKQSVLGKRTAGSAVPAVVLQKAESELAAADARLRELQNRQPGLEREIEALRQKVAALQSQLRLLVEETRQLAEAEATVQSATALRDSAELQLQKARLELERTTIRAPMNGRILRLLAGPGMRVTGLQTSGDPRSSSVVEMYDPDRMQARADVRLEDVPLVQPGQPVRIETASAGQPIEGKVLQPNSTANIQKNTLEVKVELINPPPTVRPEMLVTATFLAPRTPAAEDRVTREAGRLFVPRVLLQGGPAGENVWIVDAADRARKVRVTSGSSGGDELVEITAGLQVTDKLITSDPRDLRDGQPVRVAGEDLSIGRQ